jgi:uncharacterized protein (TIGR02594 family)
MSRLSDLIHRIEHHRADDVMDEFMVLLRGRGQAPQPLPTPSLANKYIDAKSGRPIWIERAVSYIGVKEFPGDADNPVILNWAKGTGGDTALTYTHDKIPWCKLFEVAVIRECGLKYDDSLWALDTLKWGVGLEGPAVGAVAAMKRDGGGHVTFVVGRDQHDNIMCCGGNQSDAVNIKPFDPDRVVGWRWPSEAPLPKLIGFDSLPLVASDGRVSTQEG